MSDITATTVTADGVAVAHPARVKSIYYIRGSSAGSIVLKDGGSGGTTLGIRASRCVEVDEGDIGMILPQPEHLATVLQIFRELAAMSGLRLKKIPRPC